MKKGEFLFLGLNYRCCVWIVVFVIRDTIHDGKSK